MNSDQRIKRPRILLLFCPVWDLCGPYASISYLGAFLRREMEVTVRDLNVEMHDMILSDAFASQVHEDLQQESNHGLLQRANILFSLVAGRIDESKALLRASSCTFEELKAAKKTLDLARQLVCLFYLPSHFDDTYFYFDLNREHPDLDALGKNIANRRSNVFLDIYIQHFADAIDTSSYDLIGASLTGVGQIVPTFSILHYMKHARKATKIVVGGALLPYLQDSGALRSPLFEFVDWFVVGEGEILLRDLALGKKIDQRVITPSEIEPLDANDQIFPMPDYRSYSRKLYFSSAFVVPYITRRRCYWNRCTFCSLTKVPSRAPSKCSAEIAEEVISLANREQSKYFLFSDSAMPVEVLRVLSERLVRAKTEIFWIAIMRFEEELTLHDLENAYAAGCRWIQFGLESGSQKILDDMEKGTRLEVAERVLRWCQKARIFVTCFVMFGYPTETDHDRELTVAMLRKHRERIGNVAVGPFRLERTSRLLKQRAKHNILSIDERGLELSPYVRHFLANTSGRSNLKAFWKAFEDEFRFAAFNCANLPHSDNYQQFFHILCNDYKGLTEEVWRGIDRKKRSWQIIYDADDFEISIVATSLSILEVQNQDGSTESDNFWIIRKRPIPSLYKANSTYVATLKALQDLGSGCKLSRLVSSVCRSFDVEHKRASADLRHLLWHLVEEYVVTVDGGRTKQTI